MITLVGLWLLLEATVDIRISFGDMWPLLLVFARRLSGVARARRARASIGGADDRSMVSAVAILGGVNRGNNSRAFRGGDLTAIMGGCEIDLRQAAIDGEAVDRRVRDVGRHRDPGARGLDGDLPGDADPGRRRGQDAAAARRAGAPADRSAGS